MKNEQEIVRSVFDAYIRDAKATSTKKDRPTFDMLEKVKNMAIKALEQPTSDDCISQQVTLDAIIKELGIRNESYLLECEKPIYNVVKNMPPVTPTFPSSDDCVSRKFMYELGATCIATRDKNNKLIALGTIENLPPVTPTQRWIPCSERLPEDRNIVLVTAYWHETYQVMMASYFGDGLWWCVPFNNCGDHMQKLNPKAWQPLPKPYKEMRGSEE